MLSLLVTLVILALIFTVVWWGWGQIGPKIGEPFRTLILVILVLCIVVSLIYVLTGKLRIPLNL